MASEVVDVRVDRAVSLTITYDDGCECQFELPELRQSCPCATCRGIRDAGNEVVVMEDLSITDAEFVGAWGISLTWSDGHATGIYPWDALRRWCDERAR
jgi:DUF971 family protein